MINITLTRIDSNGVPSGTYSGPAEIVNLNCEGWTTVQGSPGGDWWDSELSEWKVKPAQPDEYHVFDYITKQWYDPRTLDDLKAAKWEEVKRWRAEATVAPQLVTRFGVFDGDAAGVDNIKSTVLGLREAGAIGMAPSTISWTLYDNSTVELTPNELSEVAAMLLARGDAAHERARVLRSQIEAATTQAEVDAVTW